MLVSPLIMFALIAQSGETVLGSQIQEAAPGDMGAVFITPSSQTVAECITETLPSADLSSCFTLGYVSLNQRECIASSVANDLDPVATCNLQLSLIHI